MSFEPNSEQTLPAHFGDELATSQLLASELNSALNPNHFQTAITSDMLILNNSQLDQPQAFNLSTIEQILKLSPSDLEILDESQLDMLNAVALNSVQVPSGPMPSSLPLQNFANPKATSNSNNNNKTSKVVPKSLHSYMRRLASIYYPVQQQLSAMLSTPSTTTTIPPGVKSSPQQQLANHLLASQLQQAEPSTSGSSSSFSLANLVPKPKIDLSKASLSKKFNKFRLKSGRKLEPQQASASSHGPSQQRPPTPANEFNYDIFNNQLAQLEKQQRQLQSLESIAAATSWPPVRGATGGPLISPPPSSESLNYLPFMSSSNLDDTAAIFASMSESSGPQMDAQQLHPMEQQQVFQSQQAPIMFEADRIRLAPRPHTTHLGPPTHLSQQPQVTDYLTMGSANRTAVERPPRPTGGWSSAEGDQQQAVFITRLPQGHFGSQQIHNFPGGPQRPGRLEQQVAARYPNIQPYAPPPPDRQRPHISYLDSTDYSAQARPQPAHPLQQPAGGQLSSMPSLALSIHESQDSYQQQQQQPQQLARPVEAAESLSGSGSGSHYAFRQQPKEADAGSTGDQLDHMLAIERFSKQSSERRPPSVVHPLTGEQVHEIYEQEPQVVVEIKQVANQTAPKRFSSMLVDQQPVGQQQNPNEVLETEQSVQAADLRRLNASEQSTQPASQPLPAAPTTTQSVPQVLLRPVSLIDFFASDPPATTATTPLMFSPSPPAASYTLGPLQPSSASPNQSTNRNEPELVFKSTLVEPLTSTLVPAGQQAQTTSGPEAANNFPPSSLHFDSSPFTPIEVYSNPALYFGTRSQQQQVAAASLIAARLRPPPLIESMLSQYQAPFRPEPPVQVASYLAQQLTGHNPLPVASERSAVVNQQVETSASSALSSTAQSQQQNRQQQSTSPNSPQNNQTSGKADLIILKPALITNQTPQTFMLKPEYLTTSQFRPTSGLDNSLGPDLYYNSALDQSKLAEAPARRLAGYQFERLSSLSSPPSTSIALDPMQASSSLNTAVLGRLIHEVDLTASPSNGDHNRNSTSTSSRLSPSASSNSTATTTALGSQQHRHGTKLIHQNVQDRGLRQNGDSDGLRRDNNTDNAILSHVMSLISSNAIPTPPLIPVSSYSNADYFLPISDHRTQRSIRS